MFVLVGQRNTVLPGRCWRNCARARIATVAVSGHSPAGSAIPSASPTDSHVNQFSGHFLDMNGSSLPGLRDLRALVLVVQEAFTAVQIGPLLGCYGWQGGGRTHQRAVTFVSNTCQIGKQGLRELYQEAGSLLWMFDRFGSGPRCFGVAQVPAHTNVAVG